MNNEADAFEIAIERGDIEIDEYGLPFADARSMAEFLLNDDNNDTEICGMLNFAAKFGPESSSYETVAGLIAEAYSPPKGWVFTVYDVVDTAMYILFSRWYGDKAV